MGVGNMLAQIPTAGWAAIIGAVAGSFLALPGLLISLRHARKLQAKQLAHDVTERTRERQMAWRRDVHLQAAEAVSRLSAIFPNTPDLRISDQELAAAYIENVSKIAEIQVIGSDETVAAVNAYLGL